MTFRLPTAFLLIAAISFHGVSIARAATSPTRPNIVFILADDLGYADIGAHGCTDIPTPNIDSIAAGGVRFTNGYSNHAFCSPMRAGFMTGRYQHRFGYETNVPYDPQNPYLGLPNNEITIPQRLKEAGYATAAFGKWHLGAHATKHPNRRGFDFFYGFLGGGHDYFTADLSQKDHEGYKQPLMRNGIPEGVPEYLTTALSREAVEWIHENKDQPFFLYLAYNAPHTPLQAPGEQLARFSSIKDKKRRTYAAMVSEMDNGIGTVLKTLDDLGLRENTVVAFLSDNGGPYQSNGSRNSPLRDGKGSVFEGGIRVPFLVSWPAGLPSGKTCDSPAIALDLSVTALHLAKASTEGELDGRNLLPLLTGDTVAPPHEALFWRMGNSGNRSFAVRSGSHKFLVSDRKDRQTTCFFDLESDLSEKHNLIDSRPEEAQRLQALWKAWNQANIPPAFHGFGPYHKAKDQFYKELRDLPADQPR